MAAAPVIPWFETASRRTRWLVGVSGGADSVALLHLLVEAGFRNLVVCHLDHGLRGRSSAADARFVAGLAKRLGLACELGIADVKTLMKNTGHSMETAARLARHRFFADCAAWHRSRRVLLAHHADDQAETLLWNLLRGSRGLQGMETEQSITVNGRKLTLVRPLLDCRHRDLVDWLESRNLRWREDASNAQSVAIRNRLRHEVLPLLEEITGRDPVPPLVRLAGDFRALEELEQQVLDAANLLDPQGRIHLPSFRSLPPSLQRTAIRNFLQASGIREIDRALLDRSVALSDPAAGPSVNLPGGGRLRRSGGRLWLDRPLRLSTSGPD